MKRLNTEQDVRSFYRVGWRRSAVLAPERLYVNGRLVAAYKGEPVPAAIADLAADDGPEDDDNEGRCQGVTQSGSQCSRNATEGDYCATHAPTEDDEE